MRIRESVIGLLLIAPVPAVHAEMEPMSNQEMGDVTGQSMLALDVTESGDMDFTRYTMGLEADFQMNMEELAVGETTNGTDVAVNNLSFGHIARESGQQFDGSTYDAGDIVPFIGRDPYLELADDENGDVVGFRVGFTESRGTLSGDISSLTGRLGLELEDGSGNVQQGQLLDDSGAATSQRATHYGLPDSADCSAGGADCAALSAFETLEIGDYVGDDSAADFTNDFFISFQNQAVEWDTPGADGSVQADAGVFMNIPTAMRVQLQELTNDVVSPRARTEYIDRGEGLF
ncbi:hypothetical protein CK501_07730 [Halovibrio salipaludis]|uniref:DUF6160 domain-containing protein n=1 Tax=Halovibrio salipaludis TaxID=2032626 RepID=A0A2A2FA15_9GAMM|nr:DUF6160 family protein [Halovibrio salipaludis]PAU81425.1 hypothetical protein CK501_07730 [Halovibrio salipaludis]